MYNSETGIISNEDLKQQYTDHVPHAQQLKSTVCELDESFYIWFLPLALTPQMKLDDCQCSSLTLMYACQKRFVKFTLAAAEYHSISMELNK